MRDNALKNSIDAGARMVETIAASREAVTDKLQEGRETVKQLVKRTRHTAEDFLDEATHNIKKFPIGSVVMAFTAGALIGVMLSRNGRR